MLTIHLTDSDEKWLIKLANETSRCVSFYAKEILAAKYVNSFLRTIAKTES